MKKMIDFMEIVKSLGDSGLLIKSVSNTIKNEQKQKGGFFGMLLSTLGARLLGNIRAEKAAWGGDGVIWAGERTNSVDWHF